MTAVMVNRNVDDVTGCELEKKTPPRGFTALFLPFLLTDNSLNSASSAKPTSLKE